MPWIVYDDVMDNLFEGLIPSFHYTDTSGWPGVLNLGVTPNSFKNSFVRLEVKLVPWSLVMTDGTHTSTNKFSNSSHTAFDDNDFIINIIICWPSCT